MSGCEKELSAALYALRVIDDHKTHEGLKASRNWLQIGAKMTVDDYKKCRIEQHTPAYLGLGEK